MSRFLSRARIWFAASLHSLLRDQHGILLVRVASFGTVLGLIALAIGYGGGTSRDIRFHFPGIAAAVRESAPQPEPAVQSAPEDTIFVFGPRRFEGWPIGVAVYVERFLVQTSFTPTYTLRVENGEPDGTNRVDSAVVVLNHSPVLTGDDFRNGGHVLTRQVTLLPEDTLAVLMKEGSGTYFDLSLYTTPNPTFTVYGPRGVEVVSGGTVTVNDSFALPTGSAPPYRVHVVNGEADGKHRVTAAYVTLNGVDVLTPSDVNLISRWVVKETGLASGMNTVRVRAVLSAPGSHLTVRFTATDSVPPVLTIDSPAEGFVTSASDVEVSGTIDDRTTTRVAVNGVSATVSNNTSYVATVPLSAEGDNLLTATATDAAGNQTDSTRTVIRDTEAPILSVVSPADGLVTNQPTLTVSGTVTDLTAVTVNANGVPLPVDGAGAFSGQITLAEGAKIITVTATDAAENTSAVVRIVTLDTQPPVITWAEPTDGATVTTETVTVSGTVSDATTVTLTANGAPIAVAGDGSFSGEVPLDLGPNTITLVATDAATNSSSEVRTVTRQAAGPPDPATVASAIDPTVTTTLAAATEFLYTGADPIQTGVAPGTIEPVRAAVLRGRVLDRSGAPLSGVAVSIVGHPEFGGTLSRSDGMFDMAVNGGGRLTVDYAKAGFLPAQRPVLVPWQDYASVDDVVMIPVDTAATVIDFSEPIEVARGSVVTDADGTRQATLLFEQGTQATMVLPDGSSQLLSSMSVRATEYTVGPNGRETMPAPLPPTSAYTYAVELSADEAIAAGAKEIQFSQAVPVYVENFLEFPVGMDVPVGYYDRKKAQWIPSPDGRVLEVVGVTSGMADLDTNGDGLPDDGTTLAALGITNAERTELASLYTVGQRLWRFEVGHFSIWDANMAWGPPLGAKNWGRLPKPDPKTDDCERDGSIIRCQSQTLGEAIAVTGTPFALHYESDRVVGRRSNYTLEIPLTDPTLPDSLRRVELQIEVAGQVFSDTFPAQPDLSYTFVWDGKDAYGRVLEGAQPITVRVGYVYPGFYQSPAALQSSFGYSGNGVVVGRTREEITLGGTWTGLIGGIDMARRGLGGWSLSPHHAYDPIAQQLYRGDGEKRSTQSLVGVIDNFAGILGGGYSGDGGPATEARLGIPQRIALGADGSLYIVEWSNHVVRRVAPDGTIHTFAGTGIAGFSGDGGPATAARLASPSGVDVGPDGSVYVAEENNERVRRIDPNGIITTIAGSNNTLCTPGFAPPGCVSLRGDGGPATSAAFSRVKDVAVGPDGSIYVSDGPDNTVRRVAPDGIITTFAGTPGTSGLSGDSGLATLARLRSPEGLAIGPDGSVYIADFINSRIRRVGLDGIITTVAGSVFGSFGAGDGGPATAARLARPADLAFGPDGSFYIVDPAGRQMRVRRVDPEGIIRTAAGSGQIACSPRAAWSDPCVQEDGDGGPARAAALHGPHGIAIDPKGVMYIADDIGDEIRRVAFPLPDFTNEEILVAAEDGSEVYAFTAAGRHLRTLDALTGAGRFEFAYDSAGRLIEFIDGDSLVTIVERNASADPTAIVASFGQRTTLTVDSAGFLATVTNPTGEIVHVSHSATGLLASLTDPKSNTYTFTYDSLGRLGRDDDPAAGFETLTRMETATGYEVALSTALGRTTRYEVQRLPGGGVRQVNTDAAGLSTVSTVAGNGTITTTSPDGTITTLAPGPDPRLGMEAPILKRLTVTTPGGLSSTVTASRRLTQTLLQIDTVFVNGRVYTRTFDPVVKRFTNLTPEGRASVIEIDSLARPVEEQLGNLEPVQYEYDTRGRLIQVTQGERVMSFTYDANGRLFTMTDPLARVDSLFYDGADRLVRQVLPDGHELRFSHDPAGNVVSVTPPGGQAHVFAYNAVDLDTAYLPPDLVSGPTPTRYAYDLDRQLVEVLRPDGEAIEFAYDSLSGRLRSVTVARGAFRYAYGSGTGRLTTITTPEGDTLAFTHDGALVTQERWAGHVSGSVTHTYDSDFRVNAVVVNAADTAQFFYDGDGFLTGVGRLAVARDPTTGLVTSTGLDSITTRHGYNTFGELVADTAFHAASAIYATALVRDSVGRIRERVETVEGVTTAYAYSYDDMGRLVQVTKDGVVAETYEYDANGNRTRFTGPTGTVIGSYDAQDRLVAYGSASYGYTAAGELSTKIVGVDTTHYSYDALGSLQSVRVPNGTLIEYVIDGRNRRVGKRVSGNPVQGLLYQDQLKPVAELDGNGQVVSRFVYGSKANVPDYVVKAGTTYRIVSDHLGSVRLVVDAVTGQVVQRLDYDAFGQVTTNTNPGFQPFGFAGGILDQHTGLVRFGARDYEGSTGRWTSKDPVLFAAGNANLYGYVLNDPINLFDPSGLQGVLPHGIGVVVTGEAELGFTGLEAAVMSQAGGGFFWGGPGGFMHGSWESEGSFLGGPYAWPNADPNNFVHGAFIGASLGLWASNARCPEELAAALGSPLTVSVALGKWDFGLQVGYSDGVWYFAVAPPGAGVGLGASASRFPTTTTPSSN